MEGELMLYFQFEYHCKNIPVSDREAQRDMREDVFMRSKELNQMLDKKARFYVIDTYGNGLTICGAIEAKHSNDWLSLADSFFLGLNLKGRRTEATEITIAQFLESLSISHRNLYISNDDEIKKELGLDSFFGYRSFELEEYLLNQTYTKRQAITQCRKLLCGASMLPELERIFTPLSTHGFHGHPVHYAIVSDDIEVRSAIRELLLGSLVSVKRLQSRRLCFIPSKQELMIRRDSDLTTAGAMYQVQNGGTIVVQSIDSAINGGAFGIDEIKQLSSLIRRHRQDVLTIFEFEKSDSRLLKKWMKSLSNVPFVCLEEETVLRKTAVSHLKGLAKADGITNCESLPAYLPSNKKGFLHSDLSQIYDTWHGDHLRTVVYKQYNDLPLLQHRDDALLQGDAFNQLESMIGLAEVKRIIRQLIDFHNTRKLLDQRSKTSTQSTMHMVFSGSPGTAKTTVARLLAKIMRDNELLSVGELIEVGRADIVDRYVGGTAPKVRDLFKRAKGSVLFIDEAYSLMDGNRGLYGDEAISAIVQEMENSREDTAVIFAGYAEKMDGFLELNPGLRSRIAFHVPFPNYSCQELAAILTLIAKQDGIGIETSAQSKIHCIIANAMENEGFGNGRFIRNLFEQARMNQASRLMACGYEEGISDALLLTLNSEDFTMPTGCIQKQPLRKIGFQIQP